MWPPPISIKFWNNHFSSDGQRLIEACKITVNQRKNEQHIDAQNDIQRWLERLSSDTVSLWQAGIGDKRSYRAVSSAERASFTSTM